MIRLGLILLVVYCVCDIVGDFADSVAEVRDTINTEVRYGIQRH